MILPEMMVPVSIELFTMNLEHFLEKFINTESKKEISYKKQDFSSNASRFILYCQQNSLRNSYQTRIGEIDVVKVHSEKVRINAAIYNFEKIQSAIDFFNEFYVMIYENWEYAPYYSSADPNVRVVVDWTLIGVASENDIVDMFYSETDSFGSMPNPYNRDLINFAISLISDNSITLVHPEYAEIIQKYQSEINKGLPKISDVDLPADTPKPVVREKIRRRFKRIKEIKDKHMDWSQVRVMMEYNSKYADEEKIEVWDLQYAYKRMGENWKNVNELK